MTEFTTNLHFSLVDFNVATWHDEINDNFRSLDALISAFTGVTGLLGPWDNSTAYTVGQRTIDTDLDSLWEVAIAHTSSASGTFADYRAAQPTHWTLVSAGIPNPYAVPGNFSVGGTSALHGTTITGNATVSGTLGAGNTTITGTMNVSGVATVDDLVVTDDVTIGDDVVITGDLDVNGAVSLKGTTTNNDATTGDYGELLTAEVLTGAAVSLTTATAKTVVSLALTAGDWKVYGSVSFNPAATTSITILAQSISNTTDTVDVTANRFSNHTTAAIVPNAQWSLPTIQTRVSLAAPTTIYLVARATFTVSTLAAWGRISARRMR